MTFVELVETIRAAVGSRARIVRVPSWLLPPISAGLSRVLRDVLLTGDEYHAMADGLADTDSPTTALTALTEWIAGNATTLGRAYANELARHY